MDEDEKKILFEIDNLHSLLQQEKNGKWNGTYMMKPSGDSFTRNANLLLEKILQLKSKFNPDYLSDFDVSAYRHTCKKEVGYVENNYEKTIKKNAPRIRNEEFLNSMYIANHQIDLDLFLLFKKIAEVKSNKLT